MPFIAFWIIYDNYLLVSVCILPLVVMRFENFTPLVHNILKHLIHSNSNRAWIYEFSLFARRRLLLEWKLFLAHISPPFVTSKKQQKQHSDMWEAEANSIIPKSLFEARRGRGKKRASGVEKKLSERFENFMSEKISSSSWLLSMTLKDSLRTPFCDTLYKRDVPPPPSAAPLSLKTFSSRKTAILSFSLLCSNDVSSLSENLLSGTKCRHRLHKYPKCIAKTQKAKAEFLILQCSLS